MSGSLLILAFFGAGLGLARLGLIPRYFVEHDATLYVLWLLMGLVGLSIGSDRRLGEILRTLRPRVLLLPLATTVALLSNILREILTLVGTPLLVRLLGPLAPISCGGASTMDTTLPIIARYAGRDWIFVSIVHAMILDFSVPFWVIFFCTL